MNKELRKIPFDEFATNLARIFDRVVTENVPSVVEGKGKKMAILKPMRASSRRRRRKTRADYEAFLSAAGSWHKVDTDRLVSDIYESRRLSSRPPVQL